ncbi:phosphatase domain-containing protein [Saccharicrinis aurantiacus]|uniref:phosphatase domain-containing protein n=1 Tax=Saccharicrinis aurantiacus TaxID=1849719 RepID=UPI00094FABF7|nr:App1 family protein [Saccharicrinis aurantiacus]
MYVVWQLIIINFNSKHTYIEGSICSGKHHNRKENVGKLTHFANTIKSYFKTPYSKQNININLNNQNYYTQTDENGGFSISVNQDCDRSSKITISGNNQMLDIVQSYPFFFKISESNFDVISDIDDTILVSHTLNHFKRIVTTLLQTTQKRKTVPYTESLLEYTQQYKPNYFYVSRSERNLFNLLCDTISYHNLPKGALFLTPLLKWNQLLKPNKSKSHKFHIISRLIEQSGNKSYVLIGDDTQHDMQVYLEVIKKYRSRIKLVFIRQVGPIRTEFQQKSCDALIAEGVPINYFNPFDKFNPDLLKNVI